MSWVEDRGSPDHGGPGVIESWWCDPDDGHRSPVQMDDGSKGARVAAEELLPQPIADHRDAVLGLRVFALRKGAADLRFGAQDGEKAGGGFSHLDAARVLLSAEVHFLGTVDGGVGEIRGGGVPGMEGGSIGIGKAEGPQLDQALGIAERQAAQKHRVDHAEDAGGRADGQSQCEQCQSRRYRPFAVHPRAVGDILAQFAQELGGNRDREVRQRARPEPRASPAIREFAVLVPELALQRRLVLLAEARRVELQHQPVDGLGIRHRSPHAGSGNPRLSSASWTSCRSRAASACAARRPSGVMR